MATTTNYGWTTPDNTDLVKDGASAIRTLGSSIDTTLKAQIDAQIPDSLLTTTGDIIYASGASTPARLGVGSSGQVLSVSGGVPAWTTSTTGFDSALTPEIAGYYVRPSVATSSLSAIANTTYYSPIFLSTFSADRIAIRTASTNGTASTGRLGLYNCSTTTGKPTTVVFDAGTVAVGTATNTVYEITISQNITPGWYYLAANFSAGSGIQSASVQPTSVNNLGTTVGATANFSGFTETGITGAFATAGTVTANVGNTPIIGLRIV